MKKSLLVLCLAGTALLTSCDSPGGGGTTSAFPYSTPQTYFQSAPRIVVDIFYEPGAEPFVGDTAGGFPYWGFLEENLNAIFQYRTSRPAVVVPKTLAEMTAITSQNKTSWLGTEIIALHNRNNTKSSTSSEAHFYLYFLKGNYNNGSGPQASVIGVSLGGTPIIAIFKEVIQNSAPNPTGVVAKFMEQSTVIHEMGHALGFVNNGVPMVTSHQDTAHGAHTTDSQCVMYWQNEGTSDLIAFAQRYIASGNRVMWGSAVLQDARNFSR